MIRVTARSAASLDVLWQTVADVTSWPRLLPTFESVESLEEGETQLGSRFRVRQPGLAAATYDVTEWQPGRAFTWVARAAGLTTKARHVVTPDEGGASLALSIEWSGVFTGLANALLAARVQRMIELEARALVAEAARRSR